MSREGSPVRPSCMEPKKPRPLAANTTRKAEGFPEKLADGASDQGTEKNAQRIDDGTSHVFSFFLENG